MNLKSIIAATVFSLLVISPALSQISLGVEGGANLANISQNYVDQTNEIPTIFRFTGHIGAKVVYGLKEGINIHSGLYISGKGHSTNLAAYFDDPTIDIKGYIRKKITYVEVPLNVSFNVGPVDLVAGPYIAFAAKGRNEWSYDITGAFTLSDSGSELIQFSDHKIRRNGMEEVKGLDIGLNLGVRYSIDPVVVGLTFDKGLTNLTPTDPNDPSYDPASEKVTNTGLRFSVAYIFKQF